MRTARTIAASACILLAICGCATPTPYQPVSRASAIAGGYYDERLAHDRYRVTFAGNSLTSRETVEAYLLYRAAELTLDRGLDWFGVVDHETEHSVTRQVRRDLGYHPWYGPTYYGWLPYWRYNLRGVGW